MTGLNLTAAISPDGRRLVFPARGPDGKQQLATRLLDQAQPTLLPGTEDGGDPFFSPDGQWIGFFAGGKLKKISVQGGAPVMLCYTAPRFGYGASWGEDGTIAASIGNLDPLSLDSRRRGQLKPLTKLGTGEVSHRWPQILPGGSAVLFTASSSASTVGRTPTSKQFRLKTGETKICAARRILSAAICPRGYLVYLHQGVLFGVRFDPDRLEVQARPCRFWKMWLPIRPPAAASSIFSQHGNIGVPGGQGRGSDMAGGLARQFRENAASARHAGRIREPRFSPDGRKLAFAQRRRHLHLRPGAGHDEPADVRGQRERAGLGAGWKHIVFQAAAGGIFWVRSDGAGEPQRLLGVPNNGVPWSFSPDGRRLAYYETNPEAGLRHLDAAAGPERSRPSQAGQAGAVSAHASQ